MWRYRALLPVADSYQPQTPVGLTPLMKAPRLGCAHRRAQSLHQERRRLHAHAQLQGSRGGRGAGQRAGLRLRHGRLLVHRQSGQRRGRAGRASGLKTFILFPPIWSRPRFSTRRFTAQRWFALTATTITSTASASQIADRYNWGFVNVNLRPYYAEGSKTVGFEIAEQLGWRLPDNIVCPMAGGSLITKIRKAFDELIALGLVERQAGRFFGAQATGCSPIIQAVKNGTDLIEPQRPNTIARSLAIGNPADGRMRRAPFAPRVGWAEDVSDVEIVSAMQELAETEGIFTETAGGVTTAVTARLYAHGRIQPDELTVTCITGNGLKTTDCLNGAYEQSQAIRPRLSDFEALWKNKRCCPALSGMVLAGETNGR
jgi:threonine synthase